MSRLDDVQAAHDQLHPTLDTLLVEHAAIPGLVANTRTLQEIAAVDPGDWHLWDGWKCVEFIQAKARAAVAEFEAGP